MNKQQTYPIGVPGQKWGDSEKQQWLIQQTIKRQYAHEVLLKLNPLKDDFDLEQYGALPCNPDRFPLFSIKSRNWQADKPTVLITGGVHGYETSGVQGAIRFAQTQALHYAEHFNLVIVPCVSPWGYETINRWNPDTIDPNRAFYQDSPAQESAALMKLVASLEVDLLAHIDLHETTDSDNSEFRPALGARDAIAQAIWNIPDGFYLVGDSENPNEAFQSAIIKAVGKVTHIAPADEDDKIIGADLAQHGVINYPTQSLGLCTGFSQARYCTTTEVYPDSPLVDDENCIQAQVVAITSGLDYLLSV